jgi:hypothetical protein
LYLYAMSPIMFRSIRKSGLWFYVNYAPALFNILNLEPCGS